MTTISLAYDGDRMVVARRPGPSEGARRRRTRCGDRGDARPQRVFLTEDEVVFVLEGDRADESVRAFLDDPVRSSALSSWLPIFDGPLQRAREAYFRERNG